jgi:hypothetical protein
MQSKSSGPSKSPCNVQIVSIEVGNILTGPFDANRLSSLGPRPSARPRQITTSRASGLPVAVSSVCSIILIR